jgi:hypothetical protein
MSAPDTNIPAQLIESLKTISEARPDDATSIEHWEVSAAGDIKNYWRVTIGSKLANARPEHPDA